MRVNYEESFTLEELKSKLEEAYPDHLVKFRGPKMLIISKGSVAGAMVILNVKKKVARVQEAFPTIGGQALFALSILLLGVLIPFIVFMSAFRPKQIKMRDMVADFIRKEYNHATGSVSKTNVSEELLDAGI